MDLDDEELEATRELLGTNKKTADKMFQKLGYEKEQVTDEFGNHSIGWAALDYVVDYLDKELLQE